MEDNLEQFILTAQRLYVAKIEERNLLAQRYGQFTYAEITHEEIINDLKTLKNKILSN